MSPSFEQSSRSKTPNGYAYLYSALRAPLYPAGQAPQRLHALVPASAAVRPWHWRSMTGKQRHTNLAKEAKQLLAPRARHRALERQQKAQIVWHGIALQDGSFTCQSSAPTGAVEAAVAAFKVHSSDLLQDVFNCLVLAETVYKVQEANHAEVASTVSALRQDFPAPLISLQRLQWSLPHVLHRYLLAEDNDALYVSFIGTKQRRDIMTNANIMQESLWPGLPTAVDSQDVPAAHTGFLNRARGVPIQELYKLAKKLKKRLVLTGHSLGGAIALLCTLDLLHSLGDEPNPSVTCVGFATPAVGNAALAEYVKNKGWQKYITNYLVPEDVITRLLPPQPATNAQSADQSADQAAGPAHPALWASLADNSSSEADTALVSPPSSPSSCSSSSSEEDSVGPFPAVAPCSSPHLPPRFRQSCHTQPRSGLHKKSYRSLVLSTATAAVSPHLSAVTSIAPFPKAFNNIVPLQASAQRSSSSSKLLYNHILSSSSTLTVSSASSTDRSRPSNTACTNNDLETDSDDAVSSSAQQPQQQQFPTNVPGRGIWNRTAQLARLVSFPVRATRAYYSYVPLGQQLYLNPQMVATSLDPDASAADHSSHPNLPPPPADEGALSPGAPAKSVAGKRLDGGVAQPDDSPLEKAAAMVEVIDSVVQQRREQLGRLWMHRMPTYRARFHQILYAALSLPLPHLPPAAPGASHHEGSQHHVVVLSRPIAPEVHVVKADTCASLLNPHHLKDLLQDGVTAVAEQPGFRWFWIWSGAWPAIRHSLRRRQQDSTMQITIHGHGLEHATSTQVTFGTEALSSRVVQQPRAVTSNMSRPSLGLDGFSILQAAFAMVMVSKPAKEMILEVVLPARLVHRAHSQLVSTGSPGLEVVVQSDFCSTSVPVSVHNDAQALQDSFASMLAVCRLVSALLLKTKGKTKTSDVVAEY
ncbi:TPA: hypothetical protein ACH3X1_004236 [Trebouxia sp. C0004]